MKIAIIRLSSLGDIIQNSIVLQFIKKNLPNSKITWICDEKFSEILENAPDLDEVVKIPLKAKKFITAYKILNKLSFDLVIDFQGLIKSAIVAKVLKAKTVGFDKYSAKESIAAMLYDQKVNCDYNENIIIRNLTLASMALNFGFSKEEIMAKKPCFTATATEAFKFLKTDKSILIAPFASEKNKCYSQFKEVINGLYEYEIFVCFGNEAEKELATNLITGTKANLLKKMNLKEMINFVSLVGLVIGNDSGITHLAWAINKPSITIFGNRPSHRNAYRTKVNLTIDSGKKINARKINKNDFCINGISPQSIINSAKALLNE